jgi:hypothetical protein
VKYVLVSAWPQDEFVSRPWAVVLREMRKDVTFNVNEGHRTLERQAWFYHCYLTKSCNNGNRAAPPSPFAPHIRSGRVDHAIDFSNDPAVFTWLTQHGLQPARTVWDESWHIEVPAARLREFARKHDTDIFDTLPKHVEFAVRRLLWHRKLAVKEASTGKGPRYRRAVKWRGFWRDRVTGMYRRSKRTKTRRVLRRVLNRP